MPSCELSSPAEVASLRDLFEAAFAASGPDARMREWNRDERLSMERLRCDDARLAASDFCRRGRALAARCLDASEDALVVLPVLIRKPAGGPPTEWHQHTANNRPPELVADVTLWMALDDVDAANGALEVLPGSHLQPRLEHDERVYIDAAAIDARRVVSCPMAAGDAILLHEGLAHAAAANASARPRRAASLYCFTRAAH